MREHWTNALRVDRLLQDSSPAAIADGSALHLWMGPSQAAMDDSINLPDQPTCPINDQTGIHVLSDISSQVSNLGNVAKGRLGSGRTLLNETATGCFHVNTTHVFNVADTGQP